MKFLLDTCLLSEIFVAHPNQGVTEWVMAVDENETATSVIVVGELERGVQKLTAGEKKTRLEAWLHEQLLPRFRGRLLAFDLDASLAWGDLVASLERKGTPRPAVDTMLAATALVHNLTLVTRNESDFADTGVNILNPWK